MNRVRVWRRVVPAADHRQWRLGPLFPTRRSFLSWTALGHLTVVVYYLRCDGQGRQLTIRSRGSGAGLRCSLSYLVVPGRMLRRSALGIAPRDLTYYGDTIGGREVYEQRLASMHDPLPPEDTEWSDAG